MRAWYRDQDNAIQADLYGILEQLEINRRARYNREIFKDLERRNSSKSCVGFHEIRGIKDTRHYRILGYLVDDIFTMLVPFVKAGDQKYKRHCDKACTRKAEIDRDQSRARDCEFPPSDEN